MATRLRSLLLIALLPGLPVLAQDPERHYLVDEPGELAAHGFGTGVELWLLRNPSMDTRPVAEQTAERDGLALASPRGERWFSVQATDFHMLTSDAGYNTLGELVLVRSGTSTLHAFASLDLPEDRQLRWLDVWAFDSISNQQLSVILLRYCPPLFAVGDTVVTELGRVTTGFSFASGAFFASAPLSEPESRVRNASCSYGIQLSFSSEGVGANLALLRARVE